ncbi:MmcB family DNA repair protein [Vibrio fluvialis]|nr:MmcB family DNA repair protein [Vibrio fluvialis]
MITTELTHNQLANNLARHLLREDRMVWEDIPAGPSGSVRPDVYTIQKSFASPNPISYEVKVSVSDFRSDITSAKWKAYLDFSYGVVFAVPKGLITKNDIPNGCGLMTFNGQFWNTVKRPTLHPAPLNDDLLLKLLISGNERQSKPLEVVPRGYDEFKHYEKLRKKFGEDIREKVSFIDEYPYMVEELMNMRKALGEVLGVEFNPNPDRHWRFDRNVSHAIEELKVLANETERKAAIAKRLTNLSESVQRDFSRIVRDYTQ